MQNGKREMGLYLSQFLWLLVPIGQKMGSIGKERWERNPEEGVTT